MYKEQFGEKIRKARMDGNFTQQEVEDELKIKRSTLSKYENGINEPDLETLGKLADFYNVSTDWLLGTKGNNNRL